MEGIEFNAPQNGNGAPFTKAERMEQLSQLDKDIVSLLPSAATALKALSGLKAAPSQGDDPSSSEAAMTNEEQKKAFKDAQDEFFGALASIHVRLKRQIWGLEEAGIITLKESATRPVAKLRAANGESVGGSGGGLEPNGVGSIGGLDVGWLNSRSSKVERDMEAELWEHARAHLQALYEREGGNNGAE